MPPLSGCVDAGPAHPFILSLPSSLSHFDGADDIVTGVFKGSFQLGDGVGDDSGESRCVGVGVPGQDAHLVGSAAAGGRVRAAASVAARPRPLCERRVSEHGRAVCVVGVVGSRVALVGFADGCVGAAVRRAPQGRVVGGVQPDNRQIVSSSRDRTIKMWNILGQCKYEITSDAHTDWISCVRLSPSASVPCFVSCGWDKLVKVWDLTSCQLKFNLSVCERWARRRDHVVGSAAGAAPALAGGQRRDPRAVFLAQSVLAVHRDRQLGEDLGLGEQVGGGGAARRLVRGPQGRTGAGVHEYGLVGRWRYAFLRLHRQPHTGVDRAVKADEREA
eukprot:ctg_1229.g462